MKIGVASLGRLNEDTGGRNYIESFLRYLPEVNTNNHEFTLFLSEGESKFVKDAADHAGVLLMEIPNTKRTPLHKVIGEQLFLPIHIRQRDLDVMYFPGNFASFRCPVPYVLNIRAVAHYYGAKYGVNLPRRIIRKALMPRSARGAAKIITPSEDIKNDVVKFTGVDASKITVIPHGVDVSLFTPENKNDATGPSILREHGLESEKYLLYVSALWRYKNQDKLIRAFAQVKDMLDTDMKLVLAGKGTGTSDVYIQELKSLPATLGIQDRVVFTGPMPQSKLKYLYAHANAFIFPSGYESFGNPLFEAWASGIPVAASKRHSFPEIVSDAGILFDPENEQELADSLIRIARDTELRATLVQRGFERAREFTWEKCLTRTLSLLEGVRLPDRPGRS